MASVSVYVLATRVNCAKMAELVEMSVGEQTCAAQGAMYTASFHKFGFETHERILMIFGRTVMEKTSNQKIFHFFTSAN